MNSNLIMYYSVIAIMILLEATSLSLFKSDNNLYIVIGVILYAVVGFGFNFVIKERGLAIGHALFDIITVILISGIGILYFKEELSYKKKIGLLLAIISVYLIESP
jgi:multidrug transporter EmrE-like cation transporter